MESGIEKCFCLAGEEFWFDLSRREACFADVSFLQYWMPIPELYGLRGRSHSPNRLEILRLFWAIIEQENASRIRDTQERFLLATLLAETRSTGSRRVFSDAFLGSAGSVVSELNELLRAARGESISRQEFRTRTWSALGCDSFEGLDELYTEMSDHLLADACELLGNRLTQDASELVGTRWREFIRRVGRRKGNEDAKRVLDAISYEAKVAFHAAYSACWSALLPSLAQEESWAASTALFHRLWHTDWIDSSETSLFHGHIFALHPAGGYLAQTEVGQQYLGDWLAKPTCCVRLGRVLDAMTIAVFQYARTREERAEDRRIRPRLRSGI